jgi:hypothetical protein
MDEAWMRRGMDDTWENAWEDKAYGDNFAPMGRARKEKARSRRMFFSILPDYATTNVMMASRSQDGRCGIELER